MAFNYSQLKFFTSRGTELPLVHSAPKITIINPKYTSEKGEYLVIRTEPGEISSIDDFAKKVDLKRITTGKRFKGTEKIKSSLAVKNQEYTDISVYPSALSFIDYTTSLGNEKYVDINYQSLDVVTKQAFWRRYENKGFVAKNIPFPSYVFTSKMSFNKVSTGLVETQSLFVLVDNPEITTSSNTTKFTTLYDLAQQDGHEDVRNFIDRYQLMFFIDCREQSNFRFFTTSGDEIVWSDRYFLNFNNDNTVAVGDNGSGFRVDIGFTGEDEGVYEELLHVVLIDKSTANIEENYPGDAYFIGQIQMSIETEGEDERYRTFFTNFGLPDPKYTNSAFSDTDINESSLDYISINNHSKKLYLSYNEIFPYVGTYKALINSLKLLGYEDVFFKEWYKEVGSSPQKGYIAYDMSYKHDKNANLISNVPIEERVQLKKLNWLSMMYKLNEETNQPIDKFGFPTVIEKSNYYNSGSIVKLMSLKKYLEKYILGVNCHITDVGGEGIVFERYNTIKYGTYQQVLEFVNEKGLSIEIDEPVKSTSDAINVTVNTSSSYVKISDLESFKFSDYCDGYFDKDAVFHKTTNNLTDESTNIYFGKTIELNDNSNTIEVRCSGKLNSFRFGKDFLTDVSPDILFDNGEMFFDPTDLQTLSTNSAFSPTNLPIIQIDNCIIKNYSDEINGTIDEFLTVSKDINPNDTISFNVTNFSGNTIQLKDRLTLIPPTYTKDFSTPNVGDTYSYYTLNGTQCERVYGIYDNITNIVSDLNDCINVNNENYGLRYTTDNIYGIPCFKIIGYTSNENNSLLNPHKEYFIEIFDGKMIFTHNNETLTISFKRDQETNTVSISMNTISTYQLPVTYKYKNGDDIVNTLVNNETYTNFYDCYNDFNYDGAILYNPTQPINLKNVGEYNIKAVLCDEFNNMFTSSNAKNINITPYKIEGLKIYTQDKNNNEQTQHNNALLNLCEPVYKYEPKRNISSSSIRLSHEKYDGDIEYGTLYHVDGKYSDTTPNGILSSDILIDSKFAQISNTTDKFIVCGKINISGTDAVILHKKAPKDGHTYINDSNTLKTILENYGLEYNTNNPKKNAETIINLANEEEYKNGIGTLCDVNLSIYDTTSEQLYMQLPGLLIPAQLIDNTSIYYFVPTKQDADIVIQESLNKNIYITPSWVINVSHKYSDGSELRCKLNDKTISFPFTDKFKNNSLLKLSYRGNNLYHYGHNTMLIGTKYNNNNDPTLTLTPNVIYPRTPIATHNCEDTTLYISPIDQNFVSYTTKLSEKITTFTDTLYLEKSRINANLSQHIDAGFTASVRDFNINNGHNTICDGNDINALTFYEHSLSEYITSCEITNPHIILSLPETLIDQNNNSTVAWKIYKHSSKSGNASLYFETYTNTNEHLALHFQEKGNYDVEIIIYDQYGNKNSKYIASIVTIK